MKRIVGILVLFVCAGAPAAAQPPKISLYDSAWLSYQKKDFANAFRLYDTFYADPNNGQSNYGTYYAAVAACHTGQLQKAVDYLKRSADIGYDFTAYDKFANDADNKCLRHLPEWTKFIADFKYKADSFTNAINRITATITDTTTRVNRSLLTDTAWWNKLASKSNALQLLKQINSFNQYPMPGATGHWTLYHTKVRDSVEVPFLVYIPANYQPGRKTPLYVYLHGAVTGRPAFSPAQYIISNEEKVLQKAMDQNAFIIYPFARKDFNWLYHQDAFETILQQIQLTKSYYNVDDNRVYIGGHSNGGTGAFWFAVNKASSFAAFYPICYYPVCYAGNTPLINLSNKQRLIGVSATDDGTFRLGVVNDIAQYAQQQGANWTNFTVTGTHGLPYSTPDSIAFLFDTLRVQSRDPAPRQLNWETQDIRNGQYFWVSITALDTLADKASWHQVLNPAVQAKDGKLSQLEFNKRRSGAIKASIKNNEIYVETSRVKTFEVYVFPSLIDINKPVKVFVNQQLFYTGKVKPDKDLLLKAFLSSKDRSSLPIASISWTSDLKR